MWSLFARFGGPIFAKECIEIARRPRYYLVRAIFATAVLLALMAIWNSQQTTVPDRPDPEAEARARFGANINPTDPTGGERKLAPGIRAQAAFARKLANLIATVQMVAIYLLIPLFLCGSIVEERKEGSFDLLFTTHLTDFDIIMGKFGSRAAVMLLLVLGAFPVMSLTQLFGGVPFTLIAGMELAALTGVVYVGAISIYYATSCTSAVSALLWTYLTITIGSTVLGMFSPTLPLYLAVSDNDRMGILWILLASIVPLVIAAITFNLAISRLRDLPDLTVNTRGWRIRERSIEEPTAAAADEPEVDGKGAVARFGAAKALWGPLRIAVDRNDPPLSRNLWVFAVLAVAFGFCFYQQVFVNPVGSGRLGVFLIPVWAGVIGVTLMLSVNNPLFTKRPGFFDLLLQTLLEPRDILAGTVFVALPVLIRLALAPTVLSLLWIGGNPIGFILAILIGMGLMAQATWIGNLCSLADYRRIPRIIPTFLFPVAIMGMPAYLDGFVANTPFVWAVLAASPLALLLTWRYLRRKMSAAAVGLHFLTLHLTLVTLLVALPAALMFLWMDSPSGEWVRGWVWAGKGATAFGETRPSPVAMLSPITWLRLTLWEVADEVRWNPIWIFAPGYVAAIWVQVWWSWRFALKQFDRLVGRE
jgi:hypothetical protein